MNTEQAITQLQSLRADRKALLNGVDDDILLADIDAIDAAIAALREKAERENPKPLTLEKICIGAKLVCEVCGKVRLLDPARVNAYVRQGWPTHCGQTMRLVTRAEQEANQ